MLSRRLEWQFECALEELADVGHIEVSKKKLARWNDQINLSKAVWLNLAEKWDEISPGTGLIVREWADRILLISAASTWTLDKSFGT